MSDSISVSLSQRLRPSVEAAPWVCEEVCKLEAKIESLQKLVALASLPAAAPVAVQPAAEHCAAQQAALYQAALYVGISEDQARRFVGTLAMCGVVFAAATQPTGDEQSDSASEPETNNG